MRRIVFVVAGVGVGGSEKQLLALLQRIPREELEPWVIVLGSGERNEALLWDFEHSGISVTKVDRNASGFPYFFWHLYKEIRRIRPEILHTWGDGSAGTWGRMAGIWAKVKRIVHSDRSVAPVLTRTHRILRPIVDRRTHLFLPNAKAISLRLERNGIPATKIRIMRNGVDLTTYRPSASKGLRRDLGIPFAATVAAFLGRLRPEKRADLLLEALLVLPVGARPEWVLIGGDGPQGDKIRKMVDSDDWLSEHVKLLGPIENAALFIETIDYLVLCSDTEGISNVVLEAMAGGVPVISTDVSDMAEVIQDAGLVVDPGNASALAAAIARMEATPKPDREQMGLLGRRRVEGQFAIDVAAKAFWTLHREMLT